MQVTQINNTNFGSKQRFLDKCALVNYKNIREKMGNGSVITTGETFFYTRLGYLRADDVLFSNLNPAKVLLGKNEVEINDDGSVIIKKREFFQSKSRLMNKLGNYLAIFDKMFDISKVVEKKYIMDTGYIDELDGKVYIAKREWL